MHKSEGLSPLADAIAQPEVFDGLFPGISSIENAHRTVLVTMPRYERFMSGEPIEAWVGLLGIDVLSLGHPYATSDVAMKFAECNDRGGVITTPIEKLTLKVASRIHDFGEIKDELGGVGDISHDKKLDVHRDQEYVVFDRLLGRCVRNPFEAAFLRGIYVGVVHGDREGGLARQFNAIERIGYLLTAYQAFLGQDGQRVKNWKGLTGNVLSNQTIPLIGYTDEFPMVRNVLGVLDQDITQMFSVTTASDPIVDKEGTLSFDAARLNLAEDAWKKFQAS